MREAAFIKQNKNKWHQFEQALQHENSLPPDQMSALYLEVTDHLSYAQTFYPNSNTQRYLNRLASKAHQKIYKTKRESRNRFLHFFKEEFPREFYNYQQQLLLAFTVFLLFSIVGAFSAASDMNFVRMILGDAYVNMTLDNISRNDPMAVYKQVGEMDMFLGITVNNIRVALYAFVFGIFLGVGTLYILMQNAIMIGSFQYFFFEQDLAWESIRTIWIHGTIEISVIIVAACGGLVVGKGILFPGTYTRFASFVKETKAGLKIVISTLPFFVVAGFLEGFVTRHTEMPDWLAISIIGLSLTCILFYYVLYPHLLNRKT